MLSYVYHLILLSAITWADDLTLNISDGLVNGTERWTYAGNSYYAFHSIPYALPPIERLRFQPPVEAQPWDGIYDATAEKSICYQIGTDSEAESEDCLTLSVYTPKNPTELAEKLPVLFYIHSGGFNQGSGQFRWGINPSYFMDTGEVILVSINYRLGPFGFLSTGDSILSGNAGLKDQLLALKWTQKNIANFGGDPKRVTIFGESAGGASVGYQILSTAAEGLFSSAILSSGTALCPWAFQRNPNEIAFKTASFIDPIFEKNRDSYTLLSFLQEVDAKQIDKASKDYSTWAESGLNGVINAQLQQGHFYAPVVEEDNREAFLGENPYEILAKGSFNKVPILIGACAEEGLMNLNEHLQWTLSIYDQKHTILVPQGMHITNEETRKTVGDAIKEEYSPNGEMQTNLLSGIQYYTDQDFQKSLIRHAELQSKYTDVYFYMFSYSGKMGGNTKYTYPGSNNVTHTEEYNYIWQVSNPADFPQADQIVHQRFIRIWTNFMKNLNPTPSKDTLLQNITCPKLQENALQYVNIGADLNIETNPKDRYAFWKNLYEQYGIRPFETY